MKNSDIKMINKMDENGKIICEICNKKVTYTAGFFTKHLKKCHNNLTIQKYFEDFVFGGEVFCLCSCNTKIIVWEPRGGYYHDYVNGHNFKGMTKENNSIVLERSKKMKEHENWKESTFKSGDKPWNTGMTKETKETNEKLKNLCEKGKTTKANWSYKKKRQVYDKISESIKRDFASGKRVSPFSLLTTEQRKEMRTKALKTMAERGKIGIARKNKNFKIGRYFSTKNNNEIFYASSYELERMIFLDDDLNVKSWERCKDMIEYRNTITDTDHLYNPDFKIHAISGEIRVEECKGLITQETIDKAIAAKTFYRNQNISYNVLTKTKGSVSLSIVDISFMQQNKRDVKW